MFHQSSLLEIQIYFFTRGWDWPFLDGKRTFFPTSVTIKRGRKVSVWIETMHSSASIVYWPPWWKLSEERKVQARWSVVRRLQNWLFIEQQTSAWLQQSGLQQPGLQLAHGRKEMLNDRFAHLFVDCSDLPKRDVWRYYIAVLSPLCLRKSWKSIR